MNDDLNLNFIALLTDFGVQDYFVGAMKGAVLSINPNARIVDITHEIEPQNVAAASFTLRACYKNFPVKTIFVAVVDPGVGSNRKAILVETRNYFFIAPDNGLLSFVFDKENDYTVFELTNEKFTAQSVGATFHGRDVFAPVAAHLSKGVPPDSFGERTENYVRLRENKPRQTSNDKIEAEIIHADRFGNLITNLTGDELPDNFTLQINETTISRRRSFFAEAEPGEVFMIVGSAGFLEIAAFRDSAKRLLDAEVGQKIIVTNS